MPIRYYQEIDDDTGGAPLRRELSIATVSDAVTLPDNPGPGRTLDKVLVWGGQRLERVVTRVLSRTGRGPTGSIKDIVRAIYQSLMTPRACSNSESWKLCGYWGLPRGITAPPTAYELSAVCEWLVYAANAPVWCPKCGGSMAEQDIVTPPKSSKKLVKLISASNNSSCYISLQLITLLATTFPSFRAVFAHVGAGDILSELSERMSDQLDMDPLLASSRRALVSLADAEILSLGKELEVMDYLGYLWIPVITKLIDCFSHTEKMVLALTVAHRFPWFLQVDLHPVLNTIYPLLFCRLATSSDPVEVAVLTDSFYRIIDHEALALPWLFTIIKTRPELLEHIPYRLRCLIDGLPARYEKESIDLEQWWGRRVNFWRRAIWQYNPDDPEGEPDNDDKFFKYAARDDGSLRRAKIDVVWWEAPVWETCARRKRRLEGREEQAEDRERRGRDGHRGRRPRSQSMITTAWPDWIKKRQEDEAAEWKGYWEKADFVNFSGWPRKVRIWLNSEPCQSYRGNRDWQMFWTKLSTRMRSHSVD